MQLSSSQSIKGFSFVEILVVTGVISILVGVSVAGYKQFNERQKLIAAGQEMKNIIRDAQSRAYTGEIDCSDLACGCMSTSFGYDPSSSYLTGWRVDFNGRTIEGVCTNGNTFSQKTFDSFSLSPEVTIAQHPGPNPTGVLFRPFPSSVSNEATVCIRSDGLSDQEYAITVRDGGTITDSGGLRKKDGASCILL
ncbi:hypothetical protein A3D77_02735 [Candidatus Gottesmanbacteria bacterium RIFCSPHIGHO2_02_FULL_39_11]|uniref:General secretion pathway GspH domain-containing protein n=1 Tax=Candidatus Gottesmanbacteria bacterium RIFCSPHIGHO2_02_FULL_39_11 TaxID=1798382 RepID=A0A1F5ZT21_9BACT|nr:MAG: hypothetical protein A3D77_02735 [Candidatus Gottesmanbacteria bacterium RIFCSPHIGHO2_02_FULL_39_11]